MCELPGMSAHHPASITLPLNDGDWQLLQAAELLVLKGGGIIDRIDDFEEESLLVAA